MKKILKYLSAIDWVLGTATIAYGLYSQSMLIVSLGVLGLCVAVFKPAEKIQKRIESNFLVKKKTEQAHTAEVKATEEYYSSALSEKSEEPLDFRKNIFYGPVVLGSSRHNMLKPSHFNLYSEPTRAEAQQ